MTPEAIQVLGAAATLYGLGGAFSVLFQARQMHVRGSSGDVSARFFGVYVGGFAIWLLYGLGIGSLPIVLVHAVGLVCGTVTLVVVIRLRKAAPATAGLAEDRTPANGLPAPYRPERGPRGSGGPEGGPEDEVAVLVPLYGFMLGEPGGRRGPRRG
jgi:uncharacterized protein with PQ loop repeat